MQDYQVEKILDKFPGARRDKLIPILQEIQNSYGYLNEETIKQVGKHLRLPTGKIYGIATFYNQFSFVPRGKNHIRICHGSTCHVNGGRKLISELEKLLQLKHGETTRDGMFSLEIVACLGACSRSPVIEVNEEFFAYSDVASLKKIIGSIKKKSEEPG
jgi:NADH-quinone oxidoreductase subunit E